jgi:hypothetical protein
MEPVGGCGGSPLFRIEPASTSPEPLSEVSSAGSKGTGPYVSCKRAASASACIRRVVGIGAEALTLHQKVIKMTELPVRFKPQDLDDACGAAALEMVIRYYRPSKLTKFSQKTVYRHFAKNEPLGTGNYRIDTEAIITTAKGRGFSAGWGRVDMEKANLQRQISYFVETKGIPLIACQQYTDELYQLGHFRVIIGTQVCSFTIPTQRRVVRDDTGLGTNFWIIGKQLAPI